MNLSNLEFYHLVIEGRAQEVLLLVEYPSHIDSTARFLNCNVVSFLIANKDRDQVFNSIEAQINGVTEKATAAGHELYTNRCVWKEEDLRKRLKIHESIDIKCKDLIEYLSKRLKLRLNF